MKHHLFPIACEGLIIFPAHPVFASFAGTMFWTLGTSPMYPSENGYFGYGVYPTEQAYLQKPNDYVQPTKGLSLLATVIEYQGQS